MFSVNIKKMRQLSLISLILCHVFFLSACKTFTAVSQKEPTIDSVLDNKMKELQKNAKSNTSADSKEPLLDKDGKVREKTAIFDAVIPKTYRKANSEIEYVNYKDAQKIAISFFKEQNQEQTWADLRKGLEYSLLYLLDKEEHLVAAKYGDITLTWGDLKETTKEFLAAFNTLSADPVALADHFAWFRVLPEPSMTAYYTPTIAANDKQTDEYKYPIYRRPKDLLTYKNDTGETIYYRLNGKERVPYHNRRAVDIDGVLADKGLEIAWVKDPIDLFYLHIQGAGRLKYPNGKERSIIFAGKNGHKFSALSTEAYKRGYLSANQLSKEHLQDYFKKNPQNLWEALVANDSYIFFNFSKNIAAGAFNNPLFAKVSVATDPNQIPLGSVLAVQGKRLESEDKKDDGHRDFHALVLAHDIGSAIKGTRIDYYMGEGDEAGYVAGRIRCSAPTYFLVSRTKLASKLVE